jgi:hypothetical protein
VNTPSHAILNLCLLTNEQKARFNLPIAIGAVLPDLPIFMFYFWAKYIARMSSSQMWSEGYFQPFWQNLTALFHSIPLAVVGGLICHYWRWTIAEFIFISMILHSLGDLPVHNDDAHRHFFPFSNYRFISPVSYWDIKHHGAIASLIERLLVFAATFRIYPLVDSPIGKTLLIITNMIYLLSLLYFYLPIGKTGI